MRSLDETGRLPREPHSDGRGEPAARQPDTAVGSRSRQLVIIAATTVTAVVCAMAVVDGAGRQIIFLLALVAGAALGYLATRRIFTFALVLLATRATLDITSMQQSGAAGPTSGLTATAVSLVFVCFTVLWVAARRRDGHAVFAPLSLGGIVLVAAAVLSSVTSAMPFVTLTEAARTTSAVAMLVLLIALIQHRDDVYRILVACYGSMVVPLLFGLVQALSGGGTMSAEGLSRVVGTFRHPNAFGAYLAVLLVAGVGLLHVVRGRARVVLSALLLIGFASLVMTYSRGSWLATTTGLIVVALVQRRPSVLLLLVAALGGGALVPGVATRLSDLGQARSLTGTGGNSLVWRMDHWHETLQLASHDPATGIGMDMVRFITPGGTLPHNDFVRMYVEAGWFGLLALVALLALLVATAVRAARGASDDEERAVAAGFAGSLTTVMTIMVGGNVVSSVVVLWYFFALAACAHWVATRHSIRLPDTGGTAATPYRTRS
jgi:putative inorganic carbon (HCO3(-)) transporter